LLRLPVLYERSLTSPQRRNVLSAIVMSKKTLFVLSLIAALILIIAGLLLSKKAQFGAMEAAGKAQEPMPESVSTYIADTQTWTTTIRAVGSVEPIQGISLEAEAAGLVTAINFENGQQVEKGDILVQLDVKVEEAQLRAATASANLAQIEHERAKGLSKSGSITQAQLDQPAANLERANAEVDNLKAIIDRKTIEAPFSGHVGIRRVNLGQYVAVGSPIVALQANEKVYVNFSLPQQRLTTLKTGMPIQLTSDVFPNQSFTGTLTAISPEVDPTTRSFELQGTLENPDGLLRSGTFVDIAITLPDAHEVLTIPATAVLYAPYGNSVFKIVEGEDGAPKTVKQHFIRIDEQKGDFVSVTKGVAVGDQVVSAGAFKLRNNLPVTINNDLAPKPELSPKPDNT